MSAFHPPPPYTHFDHMPFTDTNTLNTNYSDTIYPKLCACLEMWRLEQFRSFVHFWPLQRPATGLGSNRTALRCSMPLPASMKINHFAQISLNNSRRVVFFALGRLMTCLPECSFHSGPWTWASDGAPRYGKNNGPGLIRAMVRWTQPQCVRDAQ